MFPGFQRTRLQVNGVTINTLRGGHGRPLLLLHGWPQTHVMWHRIAPRLATEFTVVLTDLRGYGDSDKPPAGDAHVNYSKRTMARDQVEVMARLGFETFAVGGHDRGARVSHRLAVDHPSRVTRLVLVDIVPATVVYRNMNKDVAAAYWHWFFMRLPLVPERLLGHEVDFLFFKILRGREPAGTFSDEALAEYARAWRDGDAIRGGCEDYRAGAGIDLVHDEEDEARGRRISCPLFVLWGERGQVGPYFEHPLAVWRDYGTTVTGRALPGGHFLPEELPGETYEAIRAFLTS
jgi:haloacetate dehalogenase